MVNTIDFQFLPKQVYFIIEALELHIKQYELEIKKESISEDKYADITNELMVLKPTLEELKQSVENYRKQIIAHNNL